MKIEIDLKDILGDEFGNAESLAESIQRQVVEQLKTEMSKGITKQINEEISHIMQKRLAVEIDLIMPKFIREVMDAEYEPVSSYGQRSEKTSFRKEMIKTITSQMVYKNTNYDSDKNAFTKSVDSVMREQLQKFQTDYNKHVDTEFTKQTVEIVTKSLREKFKIN